ncbi:hypothetical protein IWZ00DRAFT_557852 [Phyllosticta capitalensis]
MDVHSFQQFKPGLKDDIAHYFHLFCITVLHWLSILGRLLRKSFPGLWLHIRTILVKTDNLWTALLGFKSQFAFEEDFNPVKTNVAQALDSLFRLSFDCIPTRQFPWLSLVSLRNSAWDSTGALDTVFRYIFRRYLRGGLTWVQSCLSWLISFKDATPHLIRLITPSAPDVELLKNNAIENISHVGGHFGGSYGGGNIKHIALDGALSVGAYLKDYAKDHWKAATDTGSSMLEMVTDIASFSLSGVLSLKNGLVDYLFECEKAASDTGSSILVMMANAASFSTEGLICLKSAFTALTDYLWAAHLKVIGDSMLGKMIDGASPSLKGLLGFVRNTTGHLTWIKSIAEASCRYAQPLSQYIQLVFRIMMTRAAPMVTLFRCLLDVLAAVIDFSENLFQTLVDFCQDWLMGCLDLLIDRWLEAGLCMLVGLLALKVFTASRRHEQESGALKTVRKILTAIGYFLKAPFDTIIVLSLAAVYLLLAVKGLIRFTLLDKLRLELIVRLNTMPGAWVTHLDEKYREGLFKSTLQLHPTPTKTTFSSLPTSIRSCIYQLALTDKNRFKWDNRMKTLRSNLSPSLLRVSHDTRRSTLAIPFNMNKVLIDSSPSELQPSVPKELQRHLLPQPQPCGREQLLDLLTTLRIPRDPNTAQTTPDSRTSNADASTDAPLPRLGASLATSTTPWIIEIREPYTRIWAFDIHTIIAHLPLVPSLIINYTVTIPPGAPRPLSKAQHLARQLGIAAHQGDKDGRFRVYVEGLEHWERVAMRSVLRRELESIDEEDDSEEEYGSFLCEDKTDLMKEVGRVEQAVEEMNRV